MGLRDVGFVVLVASAVLAACSFFRLSRRLEKTALKLEGVLESGQHQIETTAESLKTVLDQAGQTLSAAQRTMETVDSTVVSAQGTIEQVGASVQVLEEQVRHLERIIKMTHRVLESIRMTSVVIQRAVASPIAGVSGVMAGVAKGVGILTSRHSKGGKV